MRATHIELLLRHGYELFPLKPNDKTPLLRGWRTSAALTAAEAAVYDKVGIRLTATQLVVDVDRHDGRPHGIAPAELLDYPTVQTPHGIHIYCALPPNFHGRLRHTLPSRPGVEFKTVGRYVVAPYQAGYEWDMASPELPASVVPDSILQSILQPGLAAGVAEGEWSPVELAAALDCMSPEDFREHDQWFSLMCACHEATAGSGLEEFVRWSIGDPEYRADAGIIRSRWATLTAGRPGNASMGTLLRVLADHDADPPPSVLIRAAVGDFGEVAAEQSSEELREQSLMNQISSQYQVVDESGKFRIFAQRQDDILGRMYWTRYQRQDFLWTCKSVEHYPMVQVGVTKAGDPKFEDAGLYWLDHYRKKKTYRGVVYAPEHSGDKTPDGRLNIWRGFAVEESTAGSWEYLKELTWDTLCAGDAESYEYVVNWLARAVQRPWEPGGVAVVFKGPKGTGKSTLGSFFCRLFGQHGMQITSPSLLTGRFNAHLRDISALFADEAFWAGDKNGEGVLKGLVTEQSLTYEGKGTNAETGRNCVHLVMASNEDWVVPAGLDGERRFAVFEVEADRHDGGYWKRLRTEMADGGLAKMLWELRRKDISRFDVFKVPQTRALFEQKVRTMEPCEAWLFDLLDSGRWDKLPHVGMNPDGRRVVLAVELKASMLAFYKEHNRFRAGLESVERHLGIMLRKMIPSIVRVRTNRPESDLQGPDRPWAYVLPGQSAALEEMKRFLGSHVLRDEEEHGTHTRDSSNL